MQMQSKKMQIIIEMLSSMSILLLSYPTHDVFINNSLNAKVAIIQKPFNWFVEQINWLVSISCQLWRLMSWPSSCHCFFFFFFLKKKKIYGSFYRWGSTVSRLRSHHEERVYFLTFSSQEFLWYSLIDLGRMKGWVDLGATISTENIKTHGYRKWNRKKPVA